MIFWAENVNFEAKILPEGVKMKTKEISIFKADPTLQDEEVSNLIIKFDISCGVLDGQKLTLAGLEKVFQREAGILAKALYEVLPQGIFDRLIYELMAKKVSLYFGREKPWRKEGES